MNKAKIERFKRVRVGDIVTQERARLPCGCTIYVGRSVTQDAATRAQPCSERHMPLTDRANQLLMDEVMEKRKGKRLVVLCAQVLDRAQRQVGAL